MKFWTLAVRVARGFVAIVAPAVRAALNACRAAVNLINYFAHLEGQRDSKHYEPYDFSRDMKPL